MAKNTQRIEFQIIVKELVMFSIPLILSGILQQLYNWVDAFIVGNIEGELALGAIGGTSIVTGFFVFALTGFTVGTAVLAGQKYGAGDMDFVNDVLSCFAGILGIFFLICSVMGILGVMSMLRILNTPADTILMAEQYLKIIFVGIPFLAIYNVFSAVLRGVGDSKAPFFSILVSSGMNVILDILFVVVLRYGIRGAAAATILSQITMTIFIILYTVKKHPEIIFVSPVKAMRKEVWQQGMALGIPPMIQNVITASGNLLLQNFMNSFGTATVIAITTSYRIDTLALLPIVNMGSAVSTLTAQSFGAKDTERTKRIRNASIPVMVLVSGLLTVTVIPAGSHLIALFGAGPEAVQIGHDFFVRLASFYVIFGVYTVIRGYLEGIGDVFFASMIGVITLLIRIVMSYLLAGICGNMVIAYAEAISWLGGLILIWLRMLHKNRI